LRRIAWPAFLVLLALIVPTACSSSSDTVTGIVVEVDGDLVSVSRFVVVIEDGSRLEFQPSPGILFHDRAPISHLQDHLRSGEPVRVVYETLDDGTLVAVEVFDPSG
jgi:hypothetical protein